MTVSEQVMAIPVGSWRWQHLTALLAAREMRRAGRRDLAAWYLSRRAAYARAMYIKHETDGDWERVVFPERAAKSR